MKIEGRLITLELLLLDNGNHIHCILCNLFDLWKILVSLTIVDKYRDILQKNSKTFSVAEKVSTSTITLQADKKKGRNLWKK